MSQFVPCLPRAQTIARIMAEAHEAHANAPVLPLPLRVPVPIVREEPEDHPNNRRQEIVSPMGILLLSLLGAILCGSLGTLTFYEHISPKWIAVIYLVLSVVSTVVFLYNVYLACRRARAEPAIQVMPSTVAPPNSEASESQNGSENYPQGDSFQRDCQSDDSLGQAVDRPGLSASGQTEELRQAVDQTGKNSPVKSEDKLRRSDDKPAKIASGQSDDEPRRIMIKEFRRVEALLVDDTEEGSVLPYQSAESAKISKGLGTSSELSQFGSEDSTVESEKMPLLRKVVQRR